MAFALPGVLKAWFNKFCKKTPVIGVALKGKKPIDLKAAILSISRLPGKTVLMDEDDKPYVGPEGLKQACLYALHNPPPEVIFEDPPACHFCLSPQKVAELCLKKK